MKNFEVKMHEYVRVERPSVFVDLPEEPVYLFQPGVRRSVRIAPVRYGAESEVSALRFTYVYLSWEARVEVIDVALHRLGDLIERRDGKEDHVARLLIPGVGDPRTREQFEADLSRALGMVEEDTTGDPSPEALEVMAYLGRTTAGETRSPRSNPAASWEGLLSVLTELRERDDVAWELGSKRVRLHDHLEFEQVVQARLHRLRPGALPLRFLVELEAPAEVAPHQLVLELEVGDPQAPARSAALVTDQLSHRRHLAWWRGGRRQGPA